MNIIKEIDLKKRILEISHKHQSSHIGSCLTCVDYIDEIYNAKDEDEPFILSNGHAGLALYVVLEKYHGLDAETLYIKHGVHPNRDKGDQIWCSTGSLGQGLPIALGMAKENRNKNVYCMTSDGEWAEGSMWESLRIASNLGIDNLWIFVNANGYGGNGSIDTERLEWQIAGFIKDNCPRVSFIKTDMNQYPAFLQGLKAHYAVLTDDQFTEVLKV
jgi:transketolase